MLKDKKKSFCSLFAASQQRLTPFLLGTLCCSVRSTFFSCSFFVFSFLFAEEAAAAVGSICCNASIGNVKSFNWSFACF